MGRGLQRGTEDFKTILSAFKNNTHSIDNYSAEEILKSHPGWNSKCDPVAFSESLRHLVANLRLTPPEFPDSEPNQHVPDADAEPNQHVPPQEKMSASSGVVPPHVSVDAAGIGLVSDERLLAVPKQVVAWVDSSDNQNSRVTVCVLMPPGFFKEHYRIRIASGGKQVVIDYEWPEEMLDPSLLMRGHNTYSDGHNKIVSFLEHVKEKRGFKDSNKVKSVCRIQLPFQVEEQFCGGTDVPRPLYITTSKQGHKILAIELMGVRKNYQTQKVETEYDSPPRRSAPSASGNMYVETEASLRAQRQREAEIAKAKDQHDRHEADLRKKKAQQQREKAELENEALLLEQRRKQNAEEQRRLDHEKQQQAFERQSRLQAELAEQKRLQKEIADRQAMADADDVKEDPESGVHAQRSEKMGVKSSFSNDLSNHLKKSSGQVTFEGDDIEESSEAKAIRRTEIQQRRAEIQRKREEEQRQAATKVTSSQSLAANVAAAAAARQKRLAAKKEGTTIESPRAKEDGSSFRKTQFKPSVDSTKNRNLRADAAFNRQHLKRQAVMDKHRNRNSTSPAAAPAPATQAPAPSTIREFE